MPRIATRSVHAGDPRPRYEGAVVTPIFQSSVFEFSEGTTGSYAGIRYPRMSTLPDQKCLARKIADLECAEAGLAFASGMAAISTTLLAALRGTGGHLLVQDRLYGGTYTFVVDILAQLGCTHDFIDGRRPETWSAKLRPDTRAIYTESISNPLMQSVDHGAVVAFAKAHGLTSVIDNTFTTPVFFRPIEIGYDLSVHSCTKYLNGHSDLVAGAVAGSREWVERIHHLLNYLGGTIDPHNAFLVTRGMKTLGVRMRQHAENALALARYLERRPEVRVVHYPGLESHPDHEIARRVFDGYGGMLSFELAGGLSAARSFLAGLELLTEATSMGGVESLICRPAVTSHSGMNSEEREAQGITDGLLRLSAGIEDVEDLIEDVDRAFARMSESTGAARA